MIHNILSWATKLFGLNNQSLTSPAIVLFYVGLLLTGMNLINTYNDCRDYGGTDLRVRIVGARAMLQGINPYTLDYSPDLPEKLQDPDQYLKGLSRCAYPPSLLLFYTPLAILPYNLARILSSILEWLALMISIALLVRTLPQNNHYRLSFTIIALIGFAANYFWRLHVERGQYHIFITLLMACGIYQVLKPQIDCWKTGIFFGLSLALRPTVFVIIVFFAIKKKFKLTTIAVGTAIVILLLTLPFGGIQYWKDWKALVNRYEGMMVGIPLEGVAEIHRRYPAEAFHPNKMLPAKSDNSSAVVLFGIVQKKIGVLITPKSTVVLVKAILAGSFLLFLTLFIWADFRKKFNFNFVIAFAVFVSIIMEFIAPVRFGYANIQFLLLFALSLPFLFHPKNYFLLSIMIFGLLNEMSGRIQCLLIILPCAMMFMTEIICRIINPDENNPEKKFQTEHAEFRNDRLQK